VIGQPFMILQNLDICKGPIVFCQTQPLDSRRILMPFTQMYTRFPFKQV
jgi:hypothetical protein